jgi:hypothetical protein
VQKIRSCPKCLEAARECWFTRKAVGRDPNNEIVAAQVRQVCAGTLQNSIIILSVDKGNTGIFHRLSHPLSTKSLSN